MSEMGRLLSGKKWKGSLAIGSKKISSISVFVSLLGSSLEWFSEF